jgi:ABC-2 type transport system permease protein
MTVSANARAGSPIATNIPAVRHFYWSLRRELWENRSLYLAPLAVAVLILVASLIGAIHLPATLHDGSLDPARQHELVEQPYVFASLLLMFTTLVVGVLYCIDALQTERRDRSILFWKSLPVSDLTTVLAKTSIPVIVLPLITWAITVATQAMMLLLGSFRLLGSDAGMAGLWTHIALLPMSGILLNHLLFGHGLWWAPLWGWLLMVSAWARRAALLWATLPLLAIGLLEKIAFNTSHFADLLQYRFTGGSEGSPASVGVMSMAGLTVATPAQFLTDPGLWTGLAALAVFVAVATRLRQSRGPV